MWAWRALVAIGVFLILACQAEAQYADCVGAEPGENPANCYYCGVSSATVQFRDPGQSEDPNGPYLLFYDTETGSCDSSGSRVYENWTRDLGYQFCPTEGDYEQKVVFNAEGEPNVDEETSWEHAYTVSYDSSQEWCECKFGAGFWHAGGNVDCDPDTTEDEVCCCGDDPGEHDVSCLDGALGYCSGSSDNYACCTSDTNCVYDDTCYADGYETGSWRCESGAWTDYLEPVTSDNASDVWSDSDRTIELQCNDQADGSGCDKARYCIGSSSCTPPAADYDISSGSLLVDISCPDGSVCTQHIRYYSTDQAGNQESLKTSADETRIDKQTPVTSTSITGTSGSGGWYRSQVNVDLVCDDFSGAGCDPSGTMYCTYQAPSSGCTPDQAYSGTITISDEGNTTIVYYSSDVLGNTESPQSTQVKIDRQDPSPWISELPRYVNETPGQGAEFLVSWGGSDGPYPPDRSGIESFELQYRIYDRTSQSDEKPWTDWPTTGTSEDFGPNSPEQVNAHNNDTIFFRIRATDRAGNAFEYSDNTPPFKNVTVDVQAPSCTIEDIPDYHASGDFSVTFYFSEGESSMGGFTGEIRVDGGSWTNLDSYAGCWLSGSGSDYQTYTCGGLGEATYDFRGRGKDVANNTGDWSPTETTTVDLTPPVVAIEQPDYSWTNAESITLQWSSEDPDVNQYQIFWQEADWPDPHSPSGWQSWNTYPETTTSDTFGLAGSPPVNMVEGKTYYINISATDISGHAVFNITNVTIDRTSPSAGHTSRDQNGNLLGTEFIPPGSDITLINITATSSDTLSGINRSMIEYSVYNDTFTQGSLECGAGPAQGSVVCSSADSGEGRAMIEYDEDTLLRFRVVAEDRAGNSFASSYGVFTSHPLARFGTSNYHISMGESNLLPVVVTNILNQPDNITLNVTGYPHAEFDIVCSPSDCEIAPDKRSLVAYDVYTYEQRVYYVRFISSDPGLYALNLTAQSELDTNLNDTHSTEIRITFPAFFPGLGGWAMALLIIMAGFIYAMAGDRLQKRA